MQTSALNARSISVVVPVKDNQHGVEDFLKHFFERIPGPDLPMEIIIVDDGSRQPIHIPPKYDSGGTRVKLIRSPFTRNRAGARNLGLKLARGEWILFVDSDCVPGPYLISGYRLADDGQSAAYAGATYSLEADPLSRFYDTYRVFLPPPSLTGRPLYLITANALIRRNALMEVNGFDERLFSGEDLDLSFRLQSRHSIGYALDSVVYHDMSDGFLGFVERFYRYGKGNKLLDSKYHHNGDRASRNPFMPFLRPSDANDASFNRLMLFVRYLCELWGYRSCSLRELHASLDSTYFEGVEEDDAKLFLASLVIELEVLSQHGQQGFREISLRQLYGLSTLMLSLLGNGWPKLQTEFAHRLVSLQPRLLQAAG